VINVATLIADEVANISLRFSFINYLFLICQNLVSDKINLIIINIKIYNI